MNRTFKTLLLWLLIGLLPMQGMAAVLSASCGQFHQGSTAASPHAAAQQPAAPAHCPPDDAMSTSIEGASDACSSAHHACGACAACCVGASAPPSVALAFGEHAMSESGFAAPAASGAGFIPGGLERPPKFAFC